MRVFVTGASGHIGFAVVAELLGAGHEVAGLARSEASAKKIEAAGAEVVARRSSTISPGCVAAAKAADGVIHLGYKHDLAFGGTPDGFVKAAEHDTRVVKAIGEALARLEQAVREHVGDGAARAVRRSHAHRHRGRTCLPGGPRVDGENAVIALAERGVRSSVVRLPPTVHSSLDHHGFVPMFVAAARKNGFSVYVGDGANVWPAVHTLDAAQLYRLALESAPAGHAPARRGRRGRAVPRDRRGHRQGGGRSGEERVR